MIRRGETNLTNEPYVTGGNPIIANSTTLFNDILGTTQGATDGKEFSQISRDSFGQTLDNSTDTNYDYFTGKPKVEGLGYAFLFRNYAAGLGKWTTSDPLGYPDGWNNFAYGNNQVTMGFDSLGGAWGTAEMTAYYYRISGSDYIDTDIMGLTGTTWAVINNSTNNLISKVENQITAKIAAIVKAASTDFGGSTTIYNTSNVYNLYAVCYAFGMGAVSTFSSISYSWETVTIDGHIYRVFAWTSSTTVSYQDSYQDPLDTGYEFGNPYGFGHIWNETLIGSGSILIE